MNKDQLLTEITEALGFGVSYLDVSESEIRLDFDDRAPDFEALAALSEFFGTKKINIGSETLEGGYCETCAYSYSVVTVTVWDITKFGDNPNVLE